jgi:propanol-preferring alcohol dehydrogenase
MEPELLDLAPRVPIRTEVEVFALVDAERALDRLRRGEIHGAAVLTVDPSTNER